MLIQANAVVPDGTGLTVPTGAAAPSPTQCTPSENCRPVIASMLLQGGEQANKAAAHEEHWRSAAYAIS